jgi:hypothetical protein
MSYFQNPYSPKPQMLSGLMGLGTDAATLMALLKYLKGNSPETAQLGQTPVSGGTSGPMGGMAGNNILQNAPGGMGSQEWQAAPRSLPTAMPETSGGGLLSKILPIAGLAATALTAGAAAPAMGAAAGADAGLASAAGLGAGASAGLSAGALGSGAAGAAGATGGLGSLLSNPQMLSSLGGLMGGRQSSPQGQMPQPAPRPQQQLNFAPSSYQPSPSVQMSPGVGASAGAGLDPAILAYLKKMMGGGQF